MSVFVPLLIKKDVLSYRLNGCHINNRHHTQSAPLEFVSVYPVFSEGNVPDTVLIGMAACQMMAVWLGGERGCLSVSVSESMTAICQFHRQFSAQCAAHCIIVALLYAHHTTPLNCENITKTDIRVKHSRLVNAPTPLNSVVAYRFVDPNSVAVDT